MPEIVKYTLLIAATSFDIMNSFKKADNGLHGPIVFITDDFALYILSQIHFMLGLNGSEYNRSFKRRNWNTPTVSITKERHMLDQPRVIKCPAVSD